MKMSLLNFFKFQIKFNRYLKNQTSKSYALFQYKANSFLSSTFNIGNDQQFFQTLFLGRKTDWYLSLIFISLFLKLEKVVGGKKPFLITLLEWVDSHSKSNK